jgi:hypothetical protein
MGMLTNTMKKLGLVDDGSETPAAEQQRLRQEAMAQLRQRVAASRGKPPTRFQEAVNQRKK